MVVIQETLLEISLEYLKLSTPLKNESISLLRLRLKIYLLLKYSKTIYP